MFQQRDRPPTSSHAEGWRALLVVVPLLLLLAGTAAVGALLFTGTASGPSRARVVSAPEQPCWDGSVVTPTEVCPLPDGSAGLQWVFPSFPGTLDPACRDVLAEHAGEPRSLMWECRVEVLGGEAYVTYSSLLGVQRATRYFDELYGSGSKTQVPNDELVDQVIWRLDQDENHSRTVLYAGAPYAVTVWATDQERADLTLDELVRLRDAASVTARGLVS